jgi:hypothetical protein
MRSDLIDITVTKHAETGKAVLVSDDGEEKNAKWLPLSQVEIEPKRGTPFFVVTLPEWLATQKGFT